MNYFHMASTEFFCKIFLKFLGKFFSKTAVTLTHPKSKVVLRAPTTAAPPLGGHHGKTVTTPTRKSLLGARREGENTLLIR